MPRLPAAVVAALATLLLAGPARAADQEFEKTVPMPKTGGVVPLGGKVGDVVVESVEVRNAPNKGDFERARGDPRLPCRPKFSVSLTNKGKDVAKLLVMVKVVNGEDERLMWCDTKEKLKPGATAFKSNLCWLQSMEVVEWPKARLYVSVTVRE